MAKYSKRIDEIEFINFKYEQLERRVEKLESLLLNGKTNQEGSINNELLQFMISMLKQQVTAPVPQTQCQAPAVSPNAEVSLPSSDASEKNKNDKNPLDSFTMRRRGTFGI